MDGHLSAHALAAAGLVVGVEHSLEQGGEGTSLGFRECAQVLLFGALDDRCELPNQSAAGRRELDVVTPAVGWVVLAGVDPRDAGTASGALNTAFQLGASIGVALIGVIFFGALPDEGVLAADPGPGYADAMTSALWYAAGIAVLSALAMLLLPKAARPPHGDEQAHSANASTTPDTEPSTHPETTRNAALIGS